MRLPLNTPQFLFDDAWIDARQRVTRRWLPATVNPDPVLRADQPWEVGVLTLFGTVLAAPADARHRLPEEKPHGFRMYYSSWVPGHGHPGLLLAISDDGLRWRKPSVGLVEWEGRTANNFVLRTPHPSDSPSVMHDPTDPDRAYKMLVYQNTGKPRKDDAGLVGWTSRDGLHWQPAGGVPLNAGDRTNLLPARLDGKCVALTRHPEGYRAHGARAVYRTESEDFLSWSEPRRALVPDLDDEPDVEFYGASAFERHGWYIGLVEHYDSARDAIETHLAFSRDSKAWHRPNRRAPFIAGVCDWNRTWSTCASNGPIYLNEQMVFYFGGRRTAHHYDTAQLHGVIGFASLPLDRFCALEATTGGAFTTPAFEWPGGELVVNADTRERFDSHPASATGELWVEVLDAAGAELPDRCGANKAVFRGNTHCRGRILDGTVRWPGDRKLASLTGRPIRLRFGLRHARLFTFAAV